jgi:hypothetical protein
LRRITDFGKVWADIAGAVASMTESDPGVESERSSKGAPG